MRRCILHFGTKKTGSTSIQESLFQAMLLPDVHYVHAGRANSSLPLQVVFIESTSQSHGLLNTGLAAAEIDAMKTPYLDSMNAHFDTTDASTFVLSAECLPALNSEELQNLKSWLLSHVNHIEAVGYVRDAKGSMESAFQQRMKAGGCRELNLRSLYPKYEQRLRGFIDVFGAENTKIWRFDPKALHNGCVVQDFCFRTGIEFSPADVVRVNEGLSRDAVALLFACWRATGAGRPARSERKDNFLLSSKLRELTGEKLRLSSDFVAPVLEEFASDLRWIEALVGAEMSGLGPVHDTDVTAESDLFRVSLESMAWLQAQLEREAISGSPSLISHEQMGELALMLRNKLIAERDQKKAERRRRLAA